MKDLVELAGDEGNGESSRTFVFNHEGHTLGNVLKCIVSRYPDVLFCGYTVPHPVSDSMNFRIQAKENVKAIDVLRRGLSDLENFCELTAKSFDQEVKSRTTHASGSH